MVRRTHAPLVPALVVLLALSACSGGSSKPTARPTFSLPPLPTATETATAEPTATLSAAPTATASQRRRPVDGDVDGDGTKDSVRTSADTLTVDLSSGKTVTAPIHAESPRSAPVLGYADIDHDGRSEIFVETAEGASTQFVTPYRFDGTALRELQLDAGPARLGIGGSVTHGDGFRCTGSTIDLLSADSQDGTTYTVHVGTYRISGTDLVLVRSKTVQAKQGDDLVDASYRPDCGTVGD